MFSELSQSVYWRGKKYNCVLSQGQSSETLEAGGFVSECDFSLKFLESELGRDRPKIGEIIEYSNVQYRIEWVSSFVNRGQIEVSVKAL